MIVIIRHYRFDKTPIAFDNLGVDSLYILEKALQSLGNAAPINIKISADNSEEFNSVCLSTGHRFNLESSTIVYKGIK